MPIAESISGVPFFPPSAGGVVKVIFKGRVLPILWDSGLEPESGLGYLLRMFGENLFFNDESEKDAGEVFFAANAGGGIGRRRRRFKFVPVNVPSLLSVNPSLAKAGELDTDPRVPVVELVEIAPGD